MPSRLLIIVVSKIDAGSPIIGRMHHTPRQFFTLVPLFGVNERKCQDDKE